MTGRLVARTDYLTPTGRRPTDLVVVVPGILGSRLAHRQTDGSLDEVWGTSVTRLAKNVLTYGNAIRKLAILSDADPDAPGDNIVATGVITDVAVLPGFLAIAGYDGMIRQLSAHLALWQLRCFPYDWRLSCRTNGKLLARFLDQALHQWRVMSGQPDARAVIVAHSMGGLVARWCVEKEHGHELVSHLVTLGTPYRGAVRSLDALVNGVRLPRRIGPRFDAVVESLPSVRELLPTYACVVRPNVHDLQFLKEANILRDPKWVADGLALHEPLAQAASSRDPRREDALSVLLGSNQATPTTAAVGSDGVLRVFNTIDATETGENYRGDGTVPSDSAIPPEWNDAQAKAARLLSQQHASMQAGEQTHEELGWLLWDRPRMRAVKAPIGLTCADALPAGTPLVVSLEGERNLGLAVDAVPLVGGEHRSAASRARAGGYQATLRDLPPGIYSVMVRRLNDRSPHIEEVSTIVTVFTED